MQQSVAAVMPSVRNSDRCTIPRAAVRTAPYPAEGRRLAVILIPSASEPQFRSIRLVVIPQRSQHIRRLDIFGIFVEHALGTQDVTDGPERGPAQLANLLTDRISHRIESVRLFVQRQMVITGVWAAFRHLLEEAERVGGNLLSLI